MDKGGSNDGDKKYYSGTSYTKRNVPEWADRTYTYNDMDELIDICVKNMVSDDFTEEQARAYMKEMLPKLDYMMNLATMESLRSLRNS